MKIKKVRPVLLSAPYANPKENLEVKLHLKSGYRTTGMVEITLEDGTKGIGEAYLAVFAPGVFVEIVNLIKPYVIGMDAMNIHAVMQKIALVTGYWSYQGAAQHVVSAFDIALHDCKGKLLNLPLYKLYDSATKNTIELYGSGGDSPSPKFMDKEFEYLKSLGIVFFKIRARKNQVNKTNYALKRGIEYGVKIAVDMTQNLADLGNSIEDVITFYKNTKDASETGFFFYEEVLGIKNSYLLPKLRKELPVKIAGGEIVTTVAELVQRIEQSWYDIVQPDATVIGGISSVIEIFRKAKNHNTEVFVHCWGGPVGMAANYHAALAGGGKIAEWPMPDYPLRDKMMVSPWDIKNGILSIPQEPGLGVILTEEIEKKFKFRKDAIYSCIPNNSRSMNDEIWYRQTNQKR